jgi:uncharacterized protein (UPF0335 family)
MTNEHPAAGYIDRIVKLEEEVRGLRLDIRGIYDEAKEAHFTKGAIRIVVKRKLEDEEQRAAREAIETEAEQILAALGMLNGRPLGEAKQGDLDLEEVTSYDAQVAAQYKARKNGAAVEDEPPLPLKRGRGRPRKIGAEHPDLPPAA